MVRECGAWRGARGCSGRMVTRGATSRLPLLDVSVLYATALKGSAQQAQQGGLACCLCVRIPVCLDCVRQPSRAPESMNVPSQRQKCVSMSGLLKHLWKFSTADCSFPSNFSDSTFESVGSQRLANTKRDETEQVLSRLRYSRRRGPEDSSGVHSIEMTFVQRVKQQIPPLWSP